MTRKISSAAFVLVLAAMAFSVSIVSHAQTKPLLVTGKIDDNVRWTLAGNTRPEANAKNDRGPVSPNMQLDHMLLLLQRPASLDAQLTQFIDDLHNPKSASYHKWLSAAQFGAQFGPAQSDVSAVTSWLESQGFTVNVVYANNMFIDFSGTATQVEAAFHTQLRTYEVNGVTHFANDRDPQIPAALGQVVRGVVSLTTSGLRPCTSRSRQHTSMPSPAACIPITRPAEGCRWCPGISRKSTTSRLC